MPTIQERIDDGSLGIFVDVFDEADPAQIHQLTAQLTRVLALVKAADECGKDCHDAYDVPDLSGIVAALDDLRAHGDIPAETGT